MPIRRSSRTARLLRSGRSKMAKKLAEEAVEVVIDAMHGNRDAVVRESADLLYNLVVLWVSAGIAPKEVWKEMERRERLMGIAEKLPKDLPTPIRAARSSRSKAAASASAADFSAALRAHGLSGPCAANHARHAEKTLRLDAVACRAQKRGMVAAASSPSSKARCS